MYYAVLGHIGSVNYFIDTNSEVLLKIVNNIY